MKLIPKEDISAQYDAMRRLRGIYSGKKYYIRTFGCQQNEADGERIAGMAQEMGYTLTDDPAEADLIVVNTCAVRDHAEKKALSVTGGYKHLKAKNPALKIGVCGCMVSQPKMAEKIKNSYPYVDFTFGTEALWKFPEILCGCVFSGKRSFTENTGDAE